jgi:hypothetical protein
MNDVLWGTDKRFDYGEPSAEVERPLSCYYDAIQTHRYSQETRVGHDVVRVKSTNVVDGKPSCSALFRCRLPPKPNSVLCKDHQEPALACFKENSSLHTTIPLKTPAGVHSPFVVKEDDWRLPTKQHLNHLELLQRLTDPTETQPLLLIDSEFCTLPGKSPSIFQVAVTNFRDSKPIINANVRYDGISTTSLPLIDEMNSFLHKYLQKVLWFDKTGRQIST